jgi:hypothetical protein
MEMEILARYKNSSRSLLETDIYNERRGQHQRSPVCGLSNERSHVLETLREAEGAARNAFKAVTNNYLANVKVNITSGLLNC